jgi:hypothetical protein
MNDKSSPTSRATLWAVMALFALPVLYVLSAPPVAFYSVRWTLARDPHFLRSGSSDLDWLRYYCMPYEWLTQVPPLRPPLERYRDWWLDSLFRF